MMKRFVALMMVLVCCSLVFSVQAEAENTPWEEKVRVQFNKTVEALLAASMCGKDEALPSELTDLAEGDPKKLELLTEAARLFKQSLAEMLSSEDAPFNIYVFQQDGDLFSYSIVGQELKVYDSQAERFVDSSVIQYVQACFNWPANESYYENELNYALFTMEDGYCGLSRNSSNTPEIHQPVYVLPALLSISCLENDFSNLENYISSPSLDEALYFDFEHCYISVYSGESAHWSIQIYKFN